MRAALTLLDQAIEMGNQELVHLTAGEVDKAEELAFGRDGVLNAALSKDTLGAPDGECLDTLVAKLEELKSLQARLIDEATRLRRSISREILRTGQEQRRHQGYGQAVRPASRIRSAFISRNS
ncbi:MAG: hypothetical protein Q7U56_00750 [Humidesulfovibrio sp.]|nr:hypothetical protein [Desulfovibrio sp.]MDO9081792.1 hypothetical protein [Humidesulfovibrio sp.]